MSIDGSKLQDALIFLDACKSDIPLNIFEDALNACLPFADNDLYVRGFEKMNRQEKTENTWKKICLLIDKTAVTSDKKCGGALREIFWCFCATNDKLAVQFLLTNQKTKPFCGVKTLNMEPLSIAIQNNSVEVLEFLLDENKTGQKLPFKNDAGNFLLLASSKGHTEVMKVLMKQFSAQDFRGVDILIDWCREKDLDAVVSFLPNAQQEHAVDRCLSEKINFSNLPFLKILIERRALDNRMSDIKKTKAKNDLSVRKI